MIFPLPTGRESCPAGSDDAAADGVQLPYGMRPDGRMVHILHVEANGLECGCFCPGCGARLVARKNGEARRKDGEVRAPHFAHYAVGACTGAVESMLHRLAKQVIADRLELVLPIAVTTRGGRVVERSHRMRFQQVLLEHRLDPIRADIVARDGERELIIEIYVRHACPPEKRKLLADRRLAAIEIDLSAMPRDLSGDALETAVLEEAPRLWLWNRFIADADAQYEVEIARRAAEVAAQHQKALDEAIGELREAATVKAVPVRHWGEPLDTRRLVLSAERSGLAEFTGFDIPGQHCFAIPPKVWQSAVIRLMVDSPEMFWPNKTDRLVRELYSVIKPRFTAQLSRFNLVTWDEVTAQDPALRAPAAVVDDYLARLRGFGLMGCDASGSWMPNPAHMLRARERLASEAAPDERCEELSTAVRKVLVELHRRRPGDLSYLFGPTAEWAGGFEVQEWLQEPLPGQEISPVDIARAGGAKFGELITRLRQLSLLRLHDADVPDGPLFGLPLDEALAKRRASRAAARARMRGDDIADAEQEQSRRLGQTNADSRAATRRLELLTAAAYDAYGLEAGREWIVGPCAALGGQSVADSGGWISEKQEAAILDTLADEGARRAAAHEARDHLRRRAMELLRDADLVTAWMRGSRTELLGKRPDDACLHPDGMKQCLDILEAIRRPAGRASQVGRRTGRR